MAEVPTGERTAALLLRAQAAGSDGVDLGDVRTEWGVSPVTMRRVVRQLLRVAERLKVEHLGTLTRGHVTDDPRRAGRPGRASLIWTPGRVGVRRQVREATVEARQAAPLRPPSIAQAFMGAIARRPFEIACKRGDEEGPRLFDGVFGELADGLTAQDAERLTKLLRQGLWYQPALRRPGLLEAEVDEVFSAVLYRNPLEVHGYASPSSGDPPHSLQIEPWTLVQSFDGLYVHGVERDRRGTGPWAIHRMNGVRRIRGEHFEVPDDYDPADHFGHGFGPFIGKAGQTRLFVPDKEWRFVQEVEFPREVGRRQVAGGWEIDLDTGFTFGLHRWCLWQGVRIVNSTGMGSDVAAEHRGEPA